MGLRFGQPRPAPFHAFSLLKERQPRPRVGAASSGARLAATAVACERAQKGRCGVAWVQPRTCSVSSPTQRDVLYDGTMAGFSLVPRCPMIGSRLQKMSAELSISFFSMPVLMSSFSTMMPADATRAGEPGGDSDEDAYLGCAERPETTTIARRNDSLPCP